MTNRSLIRGAMADTVPLFIPAIPFALVFGVVIAEAGIHPWVGWSSSPIIFGGAAQVTLMTLLGEGVSAVAAATAALIVGARHLLYSVTMAPRFQDQPRWFQWVGPYVLIDQVFALSVARKDDTPEQFRIYFLTTGFCFWTLWMTFTALGLFIGPAVPETWGLAFAAPVMFTSLLVMSVNRWERALVALVAAVVTVAMADLPNRSGLLVGAIAGIVLGFLLERRRR